MPVFERTQGHDCCTYVELSGIRVIFFYVNALVDTEARSDERCLQMGV